MRAELRATPDLAPLVYEVSGVFKAFRQRGKKLLPVNLPFTVQATGTIQAMDKVRPTIKGFDDLVSKTWLFKQGRVS